MPSIKYLSFYSHILQRDFQLEITGDLGYPILMFPTSQGSFVQNRDFHLNASVNHFIDEQKIKLYNIETLDAENLYNKNISSDERILRYEQYTRFISEELIPEIKKECHTERIALAGCSFGGYHAANIGFKNPGLISHIISMSGVFSIRSFVPNVQSSLAYFNCPEEFIPNEENWKFHHMKIILSTSDRDACKDKNLNMCQILNMKGIGYQYDEQLWIDHDWPLWRMVFPKFIAENF